MRKIVGVIALTADWAVRAVVALLGALLIVAAVTVTLTDVWLLSPILLAIGLYLFVTPLAPNAAAFVMSWLGRTFSKPYNGFFAPYLFRPLDRGLDFIETTIERTVEALGSLLGRLFVIALWIIAAIIGVIVVGGLGWLAFQSVAAIPVSVAVVIGAIIIAGAVRSR